MPPAKKPAPASRTRQMFNVRLRDDERAEIEAAVARARAATGFADLSLTAWARKALLDAARAPAPKPPS